jgi:hypothetical protein
MNSPLHRRVFLADFGFGFTGLALAHSICPEAHQPMGLSNREKPRFLCGELGHRPTGGGERGGRL